MWLFMSVFRKSETLARVRILFEFGADKTIKDNDGRTAFDHASDRGDTACMALLAIDEDENHPMQSSGNVGRIEKGDQPSPPADR